MVDGYIGAFCFYGFLFASEVAEALIKRFARFLQRRHIIWFWISLILAGVISYFDVLGNQLEAPLSIVILLILRILCTFTTLVYLWFRGLILVWGYIAVVAGEKSYIRKNWEKLSTWLRNVSSNPIKVYLISAGMTIFSYSVDTFYTAKLLISWPW